MAQAGGGARAGMTAPVHRLAAVDWPPRPRRLHRHILSRPVPAVHTTSRGRNDGRFVDIALDRYQPTVTSLAPARSGTRDSVLRERDIELQNSATMTRHLKLATLVFITLAVLLLATIKFGFDRQAAREWQVHSSRSEQTVVGGAVMCVLVACVCAVGVGCALTLCHNASPVPPALPAPPPQAASFTPTAPSHSEVLDFQIPSTRQQQSSEPAENIGAPSTLATEFAEPPPPYKLAVLMPGRESPPPPAYSELS